MTQLRAFEAAARLGSFKAAAAELAVTPTAISHQIRLLEKFCGQPLFRRHPRPVTLTGAGERLFPVFERGLDAFETALSDVMDEDLEQHLVVTTTNAFASRWLIPRLPQWRNRYPGIALEVIGTDAVLDVVGDEADVAIRYMYDAPTDLAAVELFRDEFIAVCSPSLLPGEQPLEQLQDLRHYTLIHCYWSPSDPHAPTWSRWLAHAESLGHSVPALAEMDQLSFREELHGIDAAVGAQGIQIVSSLLVACELEDGRLIRAIDIPLPGYGFYLVFDSETGRRRLIDIFSEWVLSVP